MRNLGVFLVEYPPVGSINSFNFNFNLSFSFSFGVGLNFDFDFNLHFNFNLNFHPISSFCFCFCSSFSFDFDFNVNFNFEINFNFNGGRAPSRATNRKRGTGGEVQGDGASEDVGLQGQRPNWEENLERGAVTAGCRGR